MELANPNKINPVVLLSKNVTRQDLDLDLDLRFKLG